jgi:hypothetical protein
MLTLTTLFVVSVSLWAQAKPWPEPRGRSPRAFAKKQSVQTTALKDPLSPMNARRQESREMRFETSDDLGGVVRGRVTAVYQGRVVDFDEVDAAEAIGNIQVAEEMLIAFSEAHPDSAMVAIRHADFYFNWNRIGDAYRVLAPFCQLGVDHKLLHRASLAAGILGEVYAGQREYCEEQIVWMESLASSRETAIPTTPTPRNVQLLSLMALGVDAISTSQYESAKRFLERARPLDPSNPIVASLLGTVYHSEKRCVEEQAVLQAGLPRARGRLRDIIRNKIARHG